MVAPVVASVASANGNSGSYAVSVPVGTSNGDLLIGVVVSDWGTDAGNAFPAGWTKLTTSSYSAGTNAWHNAVYARVAASEPATYTISHDSSDSVAAILRITGWDSAAGVAGAVKEVAPRTTGTGTEAPSIVPFGADDLLVCFFGAETSLGGTRTWTPPTGMTEHVDRQSNTWASLLVASLANPATPSGVKTATPSAAVDTGAGSTLSIKAVGGASTVTGIATGSFGFTGAAAGIDRAIGTALGALGFTAAANGVDRVVGTATAALGFASVGNGLTRVRGAAAASLGFAGVAQGLAGTPPVQGSAAADFGFTATSQGRPRVLAAATGSFGFSAASVGVDRVVGSAAAALGFAAAGVGVRRSLGVAQALLGFAGAAAGGPPPPPFFPAGTPTAVTRRLDGSATTRDLDGAATTRRVQ